MEIDTALAEGESAYERGYYAFAWRTLLPLARGGHTKAQYWVGLMLETGHGAPQDLEQAIAWYRHAAERGGADAQHGPRWRPYWTLTSRAPQDQERPDAL